MHELGKLLNAENVFSCLKLLNIDKGCRCGFGTAHRETPSREKKRHENLNRWTFFLHFMRCGKWLGSVALPCAAGSQFYLLEISEDHRVSPRDGKGKMFKLLETNGTL